MKSVENQLDGDYLLLCNVHCLTEITFRLFVVVKILFDELLRGIISIIIATLFRFGSEESHIHNLWDTQIEHNRNGRVSKIVFLFCFSCKIQNAKSQYIPPEKQL